MASAFDDLQKKLKQLPGLGYRSAERLALHLLVERPERLSELVDALRRAADRIGRCRACGGLAEGELCEVCADPRRDPSVLCVVEQVLDLAALERSSAYRGLYHVLHGKLSPISGVGPEDLNLEALGRRLASEDVRELVLALPNDVEGEATCHYITENLAGDRIAVTRIGFGLPSGGGVFYADPVTLKSALESRRKYL